MMEIMKNKRRYTIALFSTEVEGYYSSLICRAINDAAEEYDANVIIIPGKPVKLKYHYASQYNVMYNYLTPESIDAIVLCSTAIFNFLSEEENREFCERYKGIPIVSIGLQLEGMSNVLVDNRSGLKNLLNHIIRNHGRRRMAFIKGPENNLEAQQRYSAYLEVLEENDIEFDPSLVCKGDFTFFSAAEAVKTLLDERKVPFDALAVANDEMAFTAMSVLQERNIRIPEDVCVAGFDNVNLSRYSHPSLSTVRQPIYEQGRKAFELAIKMIEGGASSDIVLETEMVLRESCGCLSDAVKAVSSGKSYSEIVNSGSSFIEEEALLLLPKVIHPELSRAFIAKCFVKLTSQYVSQEILKVLNNDFSAMISNEKIREDDIPVIQKFITLLRDEVLIRCLNKDSTKNIENFFHMLRVSAISKVQRQKSREWYDHRYDILLLRQLLTEMIVNINSRQKQLEAIIPILKSLGVLSCQLYFFHEEKKYTNDKEWTNPDTINLTMAFNESESFFFKDNKVKWETIFKNDYLPNNRRYTTILCPLFIASEHMGLMLCEFKSQDSFMVESFVIEMGCALKLSQLISNQERIEEQLRTTLDELVNYNERLNALSQTDELTGLYNRRGFIKLSRQALAVSFRMGRGGVLFFGDMDGLKEINDTYGHDEGDEAIKAMANILEKTFENRGIIARLSGDEFTVFVEDLEEEYIPRYELRLKDLLKDYNVSSRKPYKLSITIGGVPFSPHTITSIEKLMTDADRIMYSFKEKKNSRKA
jgi:diguanylate cyclase (GGDEF)-like protein